MKNILQSESLVPTYVRKTCSIATIVILMTRRAPFAFSDRINDSEFELGVWKEVFTHLVRILYTEGAIVVQQLDYRSCVKFFGRNLTDQFYLGIEWFLHSNEEQFVSSTRTRQL